MNLLTLFHRHKPDLKSSGWRGGLFVTGCTVCGGEMIKPPGQEWRIARKGPRAEAPPPEDRNIRL